MGSVELAILKVAQEGGYLEAIPENESEIIEEAKFYLEQAKEASTQARFKKDKTVRAILSLGEKMNSSQNTDEEGKDIFGAPEVGTFRGLPIPADIKGEPVQLPLDFTELHAKEIMKLHAIFNGYAARARWMLSVATNKLASATHLREAEYRRAYKEAYESSESKLTQGQLDVIAKADKKYIELDETVRTFQEDVTSLKALTEIYSGNVERLSREWTMRQDEDKRAY